MENEFINKPEKLCRICFGTGDYDVQSYEILIDDGGNSLTLNSLLQEFAALDAEYVQTISSVLCINCTEELKKSYLFLKKLRKADEQLQLLIKKTQNANVYKRSDYDVSSTETEKLITTVIFEHCQNLKEYGNYVEENTINCDEKFDDNENQLSHENDEDYIIEYVVEENSTENGEKQGQEEKNNKNEETTTKGNKRKISHSEINNVSSKIHKNLSNENLGLSSFSNELKHTIKTCSKQQQKQHSPKEEHHSNCSIETITNKDYFIISKFVATKDEIAETLEIDFNNPNNNSLVSSSTPESRINSRTESSLTTRQIFTMKMLPVEVNAISDINNLENDEANNEYPNTLYKCNFCPRAYSTANYLIKHARKAHYCQFCMKGFEKTNDLFKHTKQEHNFFKCTLCVKEFTCNSNLRLHLKKNHNINLPAHISILAHIRKE